MQEGKKVDLKSFREELGMTQQELADALDMARTYISMIESGTKPFSGKLRRKVECLLYNRIGDISVSDNHGAIGSPGAHVHNNSAPPLEAPPAWAQTLCSDVCTLKSEVARLREQLADIQALLVKLAGK